MGPLAAAGCRDPRDGHRVVDVIADPAGYNARVYDRAPRVDRAVAVLVDVESLVEAARTRDLG